MRVEAGAEDAVDAVDAADAAVVRAEAVRGTRVGTGKTREDRRRRETIDGDAREITEDRRRRETIDGDAREMTEDRRRRETIDGDRLATVEGRRRRQAVDGIDETMGGVTEVLRASETRGDRREDRRRRDITTIAIGAESLGAADRHRGMITARDRVITMTAMTEVHRRTTTTTETEGTTVALRRADHRRVTTTTALESRLVEIVTTREIRLRRVTMHHRTCWTPRVTMVSSLVRRVPR